jgi:hypothetical protein
MIKTISHEEVKVMQKIMPRYFAYLKDNPDSFLCRVLGLYRVQMYHLNRTIYFIVMESSFKGASGPMDAQYDCKGSHVGRNADPGDSVKKDNDLLEDGFRLCLGANREPVLAQLRLDAAYLLKEGFLDYSLLIGAQWEALEQQQPQSLPQTLQSHRLSDGGGGGGDDGDDSASRFPRPRGSFRRRLSVRTTQLEDTRLWEASVRSSAGLHHLEAETALAEAFREEASGQDSALTLLPATGGLPACPPPPDAPWSVPDRRRGALAGGGGGGSRGGGGGGGGGLGSSLDCGKDGASGEDAGGEEGPVAREYRIGVIDFLTQYSLSKVAERTLKSFTHEKSALSVAPPGKYAERFVAFAEGICVGHEPPRELPGGGYLVQVILKQHKTAGLELGNKTGGGGGGGGGGVCGGESVHSSSIKDVGGVVCLAVKEGCECAVVGIRAGDRVHRINGDLVPTTLGFGAVQARVSSATRPLYLTLERWPSRQDEQSASSTGPPVGPPTSGGGEAASAPEGAPRKPPPPPVAWCPPVAVAAYGPRAPLPRAPPPRAAARRATRAAAPRRKGCASTGTAA